MGIEASARVTLVGGSEALKSLQGVTRGTTAASKEAQKAAQETERWQRLAIRSHQQRMKEQDALAKATQKSAAQQAKAAQSAAQATTVAAQRAASQQAKSAQTAAQAKERAAQAAVLSAQREAKAIEAIQQRQAERWQRMAQASAAVRMREEAKVTEAARREAAKQVDIAKKTAAAEVEAARKRNRDIGGLIGTATASVVAGGVTAVNAARGASGAKSVQERVQAGNDFRERLVRVSSQAGLSVDEREALQSRILSASAANGQDAGEVLGVAESGQAKFNDLRGFAKNAEEIGRIAKASGANMERLSDAMGYTNKAFGIAGEQAMETGYAIKSSADAGSTETEDLATAFAPLAGTYALTTKQTGVKGRNQFLAMAQALNTTGVGAEGAATRGGQLLAAVSQKDTQDKLKAIGIKNFVGKDGSINLSSLIRQLEGSKKFQNADTRQKIFDELRGRQGIETLVKARRDVKNGVVGAIDLDNMTPDIAGAKGKVDAYMGDIQGEGWFKAQQENAEMQKSTTENLGSFNTQIGFVTSAANALEKKFGSLSLWIGSIGAAGVTGVAGTVLKRALGGGAAAAGASGVGTAAAGAAGGAGGGWLAGMGATAAGWLGAGGTAVGAAGAGLVAGTVGAGLAIGGSVGLAANYGTGMIREDGKSISDLIVDAIFERAQKKQFTAGGTRNEDGTLVRALQEQTRKLESIDAGLRATNARPNAGGPRAPK